MLTLALGRCQLYHCPPHRRSHYRRHLAGSTHPQSRPRARYLSAWMSVNEDPDPLTSLDLPWRLAAVHAAICHSLFSTSIAGLGIR